MMRLLHPAKLAVGAVVTCLVVLGQVSVSGAQKLDLAACAPSGNSFTLGGNSFFPMPVGRVWNFRGEEDGQSVVLAVTVLNETESLSFGSTTVTTRVVEEREWVDLDGDGAEDPGEPRIELARNYFAKTQSCGTVCYFGEAVTNYLNGVPDTHDGSWRADAQGAAPGIFMPAVPKPGMKFAQESAPGVAEDEAAIVGSGSTTVPAGTFRDTIRVRETNPLDGDRGYKVYARGVGLISDPPLQLAGYSG